MYVENLLNVYETDTLIYVYKVKEIINRSKRELAKINEHASRNSATICDYSDQVKERVDNLEQIQTSIEKIQKRPPLEKLRKFGDLQKKVSEATQQTLECCTWPAQLGLAHQGKDVQQKAVSIFGF